MVLGFPFKLFFFFVLFFGSFLSLSSSHWMGMWMGLELNLMAFIPLLMEISSVEEVESGVKYFLVQALGSSFFLWGGFWLYSLGVDFTILSLKSLCLLILLMGLLLKMGSFPFHFWVPSVMSSLSWVGCLLLATWQKLAPLFIFFWFFYDFWFWFIVLFSVLSALVGGLGGINQVQVRVLMAYSSINHLGWMMAVATVSFFGLFMYYVVYFFISIVIFFLFWNMDYSRLTQIVNFISKKFLAVLILFSLISLAGLPPMTGFFGKWVVFQELVMNSYNFCLIFLILGSLFSLYFYLNVFFSVFLNSFSNSFVSSKNKLEHKLINFVLSCGLVVVVFGLGFFEFMYNYFL